METNIAIIALAQDGTIKLCRRTVIVPKWASEVAVIFLTAIARDYSPKAKHVAWYDTAKLNASGMPTEVYQAR